MSRIRRFPDQPYINSFMYKGFHVNSLKHIWNNAFLFEVRKREKLCCLNIKGNHL